MKKYYLALLMVVAALTQFTIAIGQTCPSGYTRSPLQAQIKTLAGVVVTDVVNPNGIYYLYITPIAPVMALYPNTRAVNIGVKGTISGFKLYSENDTQATNPYSNASILSGLGPDVGANQTAKFIIKIDANNLDGQISINGVYYMCVDHRDSNNLNVYRTMPTKNIIVP